MFFLRSVTCLFHSVLCGTCFVFCLGVLRNTIAFDVCVCVFGMHAVFLFFCRVRFLYVMDSRCVCECWFVCLGVFLGMHGIQFFFVFLSFVLLSIVQSIQIRDAICSYHVLAGHSLRWFVLFVVLFCWCCLTHACSRGLFCHVVLVWRVVFTLFTCDRSTSPPGGNQVDGLPPALSCSMATCAKDCGSSTSWAVSSDRRTRPPVFITRRSASRP